MEGLDRLYGHDQEAKLWIIFNFTRIVQQISDTGKIIIMFKLCDKNKKTGE